MSDTGMSRADVRAVDNPISALFDLSEDVNREAPRFKKLVLYAAIFIMILLAVDLILIISVIQTSLLIGVLVMAIFVLGLATLGMLGNLNDFFRYYVMRHQTIMSVRNDDPIVKVPPGPTPVARLLIHLRTRNPELNYLFGSNNQPTPVKVRGRSGQFHHFDVHMVRRPGPLWGILGRGYPGYQLVVRTFDRAPRPEELVRLREKAEDVSGDNRVPVCRLIALWSRGEEELSEESYNVLMSQVARSSHRGRRFASSLELIIDDRDGTYEFIPYLVDHAYFPPG
jgi:hypothetical protein